MAYDEHFMPLYVKYYFWVEQPVMGLPSSIPRLCGDKGITNHLRSIRSRRRFKPNRSDAFQELLKRAMS
jgi:hypothetical protein